MNSEEKILVKKKRKFIGRLIFLGLGIICTIIFMILYFTIDRDNEGNAIVLYVFGLLQAIFYSTFLVSIFGQILY